MGNAASPHPGDKGKRAQVAALGDLDGDEVGWSLGIVLGANDGISLGYVDGRSEGIMLGRSEGIMLGASLGIVLGRSDGIMLGASEGKEEEKIASSAGTSDGQLEE